jgi:cation transport ATPase
MGVEVNYVAILLAVLASFAIGGIWYSPKVLGRRWATLTKQKTDNNTKGLLRMMAVTIVCYFLLAFVIAHVAYISHDFFKNSFLQDSLTTAFWLWLGVSVTTVLVQDIFERRPFALTVMTIGYQFVLIMTMGLIIGLAEPAAISEAKNAVSML